ncbi:MAG: PAS domain S-box protein [Ignavibacteriales bacterium]|nr:PAS domain S-box protein [Ignavibacteriales bacterium]
MVHEVICTVMSATNFYIALYDEKEDLLVFPYFVDEVDVPPPPQKLGRGLTAFVLRTGKSLLCDRSVDEELQRRGEVEVVGAQAPIWLGVPLIVDNKTIGVMAAQHYSDPKAYGHREQEVLEFVSSQVAKAIDRKKAEETLRASEERYRTVAETASDAIISIDGDGKILFVNTAAEKIFGYSIHEMLGNDLTMLMPEYLRYVHKFSLQQYTETGKRHMTWGGVELPGLHKKGHEIPLEVSFGEFIREGRHIFTGIVRDITERKVAGEALRQSEEKYRKLFEESQDGIILTTPDGKLIDVNQAGVELLGFTSREELLNIDNARDLYVHPDDREIFKNSLSKQGFVRDFEFLVKRKDGQKRVLLESASAVRDEKGNIIAYRGFLRDITERKKLEDRLRQAQKMESIGTLAGGIAHDFNNLLGIILGYTTLLEDRTLEPQRASHNIEIVKKAVHRGADLVRQLLTFARKGDPTFTSLNVNDTVIELTKMLGQTFPKTITITTQVSNPLPSIKADPTQLQQALLNLCVNSRDAIDDHTVERGTGRLTLETGMVTGEHLRQKFPDALARKYVYISVKDTGAGIDEPTRRRIFEPFFTTKELGKGTGLGLAVVYGVINSHHGYVDVESEKGVGTTFTLYFPVPTEAIAQSERENEQHSAYS